MISIWNDHFEMLVAPQAIGMHEHSSVLELTAELIALSL